MLSKPAVIHVFTGLLFYIVNSQAYSTVEEYDLNLQSRTSHYWSYPLKQSVAYLENKVGVVVSYLTLPKVGFHAAAAVSLYLTNYGQYILNRRLVHHVQRLHYGVYGLFVANLLYDLFSYASTSREKPATGYFRVSEDGIYFDVDVVADNSYFLSNMTRTFRAKGIKDVMVSPIEVDGVPFLSIHMEYGSNKKAKVMAVRLEQMHPDFHHWLETECVSESGVDLGQSSPVSILKVLDELDSNALISENGVSSHNSNIQLPEVQGTDYSMNKNITVVKFSDKTKADKTLSPA